VTPDSRRNAPLTDRELLNATWAFMAAFFVVLMLGTFW
jgi:hypothetical protein